MFLIREVVLNYTDKYVRKEESKRSKLLSNRISHGYCIRQQECFPTSVIPWAVSLLTIISAAVKWLVVVHVRGWECNRTIFLPSVQGQWAAACSSALAVWLKKIKFQFCFLEVLLFLPANTCWSLMKFLGEAMVVLLLVGLKTRAEMLFIKVFEEVGMLILIPCRKSTFRRFLLIQSVFFLQI